MCWRLIALVHKCSVACATKCNELETTDKFPISRNPLGLMNAHGRSTILLIIIILEDIPVGVYDVYRYIHFFSIYFYCMYIIYICIVIMVWSS